MASLVTTALGSIAMLHASMRIGLALLWFDLASYAISLSRLDCQGCVPGGKRRIRYGTSRLLSEFEQLGQELESVAVGTHLVSPRGFYLHHGIYLGRGEIAHYSGFSSPLKTGPVEIVDRSGFAQGKPVWLIQERSEFSNEEIANRARSRIGESQYRLLSNNCEHFCSWCIRGRSYSTQVSACFQHPRLLFSLVSALDSRFVA